METPVENGGAAMVRDPGLTDLRLVSHSLRHGRITKLHSAGVPRNLAEILTGHSTGKVHEDDIHKALISLKTLQDGLERLQDPEILQVVTTKGARNQAA